MRRLPLIVVTFAACGGDDPAGPVAPTCDGLETTPFGQVEVTDWPAGTLEAADALVAMPGRYAATDSCTGAVTYVKILTPVNRESIDLITAPYADGPCGCTEDPDLSADSEYPLVGRMAGSSLFIENGVEAGAQNQTVLSELTLFAETAPLLTRACGSIALEPIVGSDFDTLEVVVRVRDAGLYEGHYALISDSETLSCDLTDWALVAVE